jgi:hypothetical protein
MDIVFSYRIHGLLIKIAHKTDVRKAGKHTVAANIIVPKKAYGPGSDANHYKEKRSRKDCQNENDNCFLTV